MPRTKTVSETGDLVTETIAKTDDSLAQINQVEVQRAHDEQTMGRLVSTEDIHGYKFYLAVEGDEESPATVTCLGHVEIEIRVGPEGYYTACIREEANPLLTNSGFGLMENSSDPNEALRGIQDRLVASFGFFYKSDLKKLTLSGRKIQQFLMAAVYGNEGPEKAIQRNTSSERPRYDYSNPDNMLFEDRN